MALLCSCQWLKKEKAPTDFLSLAAGKALSNPNFAINKDEIYNQLNQWNKHSVDTTAQDSAITAYYLAKDNPFLWINQASDSTRIYLFLSYLHHSTIHGLNPDRFGTSKIETNLKQLRKLEIQEGKNINMMLAELEHDLTKAYIDYVCGLSYGFISPHPILNKLEDEELEPGLELTPEEAKKKIKKKKLYNIPLKVCNREIAEKILRSISDEEMPAFLSEVQPKGEFYCRLQREYIHIDSLRKVMSTQSSVVVDSLLKMSNCLRINMERLRWQTQREKTNRYIQVNVAAYMLQAIDVTADSMLEMRICCGSARHKTPLLASSIRYIEMNPYWNVPKTIIKKEIIPAYCRDTAYFTKNNMKVYDKAGMQVDPHAVSWNSYKGYPPFEVKQDNKEGNSLGRIIFRFPNIHDVYLHDTPMKSSFLRERRGVSHGCVRLEQPLNFASFLLKEKDELTVDRIRTAMDLPALSERGKKITKREDYQELKYYSLKEYIPVFLDYYTMYLSKDGKLKYCEDTYVFDPPLLEALDKLN
ncbi:MAG: L,D-transpeptidase family protein [Bacteroidaceae bacterium]